MKCKGMYLYEYVDRWDKFEETRIPPKNAFYSKRNMNFISDQDYEHTQRWYRVTSEHKDVTFEDSHDLYLATDVLLLADIFRTFQIMCLENYKLDPAHIYTAPRLAWLALLKTGSEKCKHEVKCKDCLLCPEKFKLELLTDRHSSYV